MARAVKGQDLLFWGKPEWTNSRLESHLQESPVLQAGRFQQYEE
eukprot:CAMPEP_0206495912 /NCGR_PEP_ID=MMETSP0324_2-20121206/48974_1 /ASSEMBLY_ACC=CAM_ASM_000836 /TAXON_ID=2866 /ORGANISM="Crypthecodinium cohnii, Strain Seligo" /LENGTH=43 /DNA_ID= /DNA_START= /DNA_END= /DNA_ORIENTATION=